jgi:hypothetical protein
MTASWVEAEAQAFWRLVGELPPFPRNLDAILPLALPLAVVLLPALGLDRIEEWLARRGSTYYFPCEDRRLRGCLIAYAGHGILFVDGADHADERRFTLAHEAAHFLIDYLRPREAAIARLGAGIVAVLDGHRPPTRAERIDAVLAGCTIGVHIHLLGRDGDHATTNAVAEERADQLACELLAPEAEVVRRLGTMCDESALESALRDGFGLPAPKAAAYAGRLFRGWRPAPSFVEWLRM